MRVDRGLTGTKDAVREINAMARLMRDAIVNWEPAPMPPRPPLRPIGELLDADAVWLDDDVAIPVTTPIHDPLLRTT